MQLLSTDTSQPAATPPFSYTLGWPGLVYKRLIVGVGAYAFEGYDPAFLDVNLRGTKSYTLRIVSRYEGPPPLPYQAHLPFVVARK